MYESGIGESIHVVRVSGWDQRIHIDDSLALRVNGCGAGADLDN